jgi:TldD protein
MASTTTRSRREFIAIGGAALGAAAAPWWTDTVAARQAPAGAEAAVADAVLDTAKRLRASYADLRLNHYRHESIATRERQVQTVAQRGSAGFGVRVLVDGTWGFAASNRLDADSARVVTTEAVAIARANAFARRRKVRLAPVGKIVATWNSVRLRDPFEVPLAEKIAFLMSLNEAALSVPGVTFVTSQLQLLEEQKFFASSDGSRITQRIVRTYPNFTVTAANRTTGDFQTRSVADRAQLAGYEYVESPSWLQDAAKAGHEAVEKLKARPIPSGKYDLVVDPTQLFLAIHETCGHSTELDRSLGWEANNAGTSFLKRGDAGALKFGSPIVNFVADRTQPAGLATVGFDDEGVPSDRWYLVKEGIFLDWQTTRELAGLVGQARSHGCLHSDHWSSVPFPRMPNVSLQPAAAEVTVGDLMADVRQGIYVEGRGSSSIDQQRYNFQFGGAVIREIKDGKPGAMVRDVVYQSRTPDFWGSCDGIGGPASYRLWGTASDGKGEPGQVSAVSHGCPPARFRQVNVLNTAG